MGGFRRWGGPSYRVYGYGGGGGVRFGWGLTPVIKRLIIINAVIYFGLVLLTILARPLASNVIYTLGVVPRDVAFGFRFWQPFTYLFLHSPTTFWHIFFNMFALWMFGTPLERDWGGRRFLRYYLLTGVGAGLLNVVVTLLWGGPGVGIPTVGASGSIYGILLAFGVLYPRTPILVWFLFPVPARIFVMVFGAMAFLSALQGPGSGVSHVSHLGGMVFGYVLLRGGWLYGRVLNRYVGWKLGQARRKFDVYMGEQDEQDRERERPRPDRWVN
ncbi:MAG: rhomboid family intramembrane serine protease [Terriglobia bacterium]